MLDHTQSNSLAGLQPLLIDTEIHNSFYTITRSLGALRKKYTDIGTIQGQHRVPLGPIYGFRGPQKGPSKPNDPNLQNHSE